MVGSIVPGLLVPAVPVPLVPIVPELLVPVEAPLELLGFELFCPALDGTSWLFTDVPLRVGSMSIANAGAPANMTARELTTIRSLLIARLLCVTRLPTIKVAPRTLAV